MNFIIQPLKLTQMQMPFEKFNEHKGTAMVIKFQFAGLLYFIKRVFESVVIVVF